MPLDLSKIVGCVPGNGYPDWPAELVTYDERRAYQIGIAHQRAISRETIAALIAHYAVHPNPEVRGVAGRLNHLMKEGKL